MHTEHRDGVLSISGEVTVKTVTAAAFSKFEQQCRLKETDSIDLARVSRADSACVSLLLAALRLKNGNIALRNLPPSVQTLTELYEIKDWVMP